MRSRLPLLTLAAAVLVAVPAGAGVVGRAIYPAPTAPLSRTTLPTGATLIEVATRDGLTLTGIARPPATGRPVVLIFHGNGSSASGALAWLGPAFPDGTGIVAAEYRGYSGNPGKPDEAGLAADADAFADEAARLSKGAPVWAVGHSLGGGVALGLATRRPVATVVTIGTFTRLRDVAPRFARALVPDAYRNTDAVARMAVPTFLVHGTHDDVIPVAHAEAPHRAAAQAKREGASFVVTGADHQPSTQALASVFAVVARSLPTGRAVPDGLSPGITLVPFAQELPAPSAGHKR